MKSDWLVALFSAGTGRLVFPHFYPVFEKLRTCQGGVTQVNIRCQVVELRLFMWSEHIVLALFHMGFFGHSTLWGGGMIPPYHNLVVIVPMIMKFGTRMKLHVFYTMVTKNCDGTSVTRYDVIICILANA